MRIRGQEFPELKGRAVQLVRARLERWGIGAASKLPDTAVIFREPPASPAFFAGFDDPSETLKTLRSRWPGLEAQTMAAADRISAGRFDLLGYTDLRFGDPIDWHLDPVSGIRAPLRHWSRIDFLDPVVAGDHKVIWELNRHQYLVKLGKAYWYSGDERYAERFVEQLAGWMDANPPKRGINWASSLEVALRAIAWIWCLHLFRRSPSLTSSFRRRMLRYLSLHGRHIELYLSTYFSPNTHLTGEALGLVYLGLCLPELVGADRWLRTGLKILEAEIRTQIRPDGVYFEQATYYHRYTVDFLIHLRLLTERNGVGLDPAVVEKLEDSLVYLMHVTRPDGLSPLVGDDDGGRLLFLDGREWNDFRSPLATAAVLFERPDFAWVAGEPSEETLWLLGPGGIHALDGLESRPPREGSRIFPDSGCLVMRDGWNQEAHHLLLQCGPHGALRGGHAHADALSYELTARGVPVLVDPGTYVYTADRESRDAYRSTEAHNTLTVDGLSSCLPGGPFDWRRTCAGSVTEWISTERFDFFAGRHNGFQELPRPAEHSRSILFLKEDYWVVLDRVTGEGPLTAVSHLHFHPSMGLEDRSPGEGIAVHSIDDADAGEVLRLFVIGANRRCGEEQDWVSPVYGRRLRAPVRRFVLTGQNQAELITLLVPGPDPVSLRTEVEIQNHGTRGMSLHKAGYRDDLVLATSGPAPWRDVEGDFHWAWIRRNIEGTVIEYLVLDGRKLVVSGRRLFRSAVRVRYLHGALRSGIWFTETDRPKEVDVDTLGGERVVVSGPSVAIGKSHVWNLRNRAV